MNPPIPSPSRQTDEAARSAGPKRVAATPPGGDKGPESLSLGDVYFILFRHKWKIVLFALLGMAGAAVVYMKRPPIHQSEARIMVRYVLERRPITSVGANAQISAADSSRADILNSEIEILTSSDLAAQVAEAVGPSRILARLGGGDSLEKATGVIQENLKAQVPSSSKIIKLVFRHPDPKLVQLVLGSVVTNYFKRHIQMHGGTGFVDDALSQQAMQLRTQLEATEAALRRVKSQAGIISVEESKKADMERLAKLRIGLDETEANLAERKAILEKLQAPTGATAGRDAEPVIVAPPEKLGEYRNVLAQLASARQDEMTMLGKYAEGSSFVRGARDRVSRLETRKHDLEKEIPQLMASVPSSDDPKLSRDPADEIIQIAALQAKLAIMKSQFESLGREATNYDEVEASISRLQRERELLQTNYFVLNSSIQQARFDEALSPGRVSNFSIVQSPSAAKKDFSKTIKPVGMALAAGLFGGILLAFFLELVVGRRVQRPIDVSKNLRLPLFATIPVLRLNGDLQFQAADVRGASPGLRALGNGSGGSSPGVHPATGPRKTWTVPNVSNAALATDQYGFAYEEPGSDTASNEGGKKAPSALGVLFRRKSSTAMSRPRVASTVSAAMGVGVVARDPVSLPGVIWHTNSELEPYTEVLRGRIVAHFEAENLTRKPKLIGITSCNSASGVSSIAASLAASLSQIGDGKVLMVDLKLGRGAAHPFYSGKAVVGVSEALELDRKVRAPDESNLVLATANDSDDALLRSLPSALPRQFSGLVPRLKASTYDYIIFDLPPVDRTSITPRVSGLMDLTLLVLESGRTGLDVAKQTGSLLAEMKANVACVLNKNRKYVPRWLQEEL